MANDFFHRTSDYYVHDDYEAVMFRYEASTGKHFRRFTNEKAEKEVPKSNKLLFDTILSGQEITSEQYYETDISTKN